MSGGSSYLWAFKDDGSDDIVVCRLLTSGPPGYLRDLFSVAVDSHLSTLARSREAALTSSVSAAEFESALSLVHEELGGVVNNLPGINFEANVWPTVSSRVRARHSGSGSGSGSTSSSVTSGVFASGLKRRRVAPDHEDDRTTSYLARSRAYDHSSAGLLCELRQCLEHGCSFVYDKRSRDATLRISQAPTYDGQAAFFGGIQNFFAGGPGAAVFPTLAAPTPGSFSASELVISGGAVANGPLGVISTGSDIPRDGGIRFCVRLVGSVSAAELRVALTADAAGVLAFMQNQLLVAAPGGGTQSVFAGGLPGPVTQADLAVTLRQRCVDDGTANKFYLDVCCATPGTGVTAWRLGASDVLKINAQLGLTHATAAGNPITAAAAAVRVCGLTSSGNQYLELDWPASGSAASSLAPLGCSPGAGALQPGVSAYKLPSDLVTLFSGFLSSPPPPLGTSVTSALPVLADSPPRSSRPSVLAVVAEGDFSVLRLRPCEREDVECDCIWDFGCGVDDGWLIGSGACLSSDGYDASCSVFSIFFSGYSPA